MLTVKAVLILNDFQKYKSLSAGSIRDVFSFKEIESFSQMSENETEALGSLNI